MASIYEPGFIGGKQIAIIPNFDKTLAVDGQMLQGGVKWVLRIKLGSTGAASRKIRKGIVVQRN
jgi:phospholipid/cholesterol/gamma-HCH transport system substrate-binding protein